MADIHTHLIRIEDKLDKQALDREILKRLIRIEEKVDKQNEDNSRPIQEIGLVLKQGLDDLSQTIDNSKPTSVRKEK